MKTSTAATKNLIGENNAGIIFTYQIRLHPTPIEMKQDAKILGVSYHRDAVHLHFLESTNIEVPRVTRYFYVEESHRPIEGVRNDDFIGVVTIEDCSLLDPFLYLFEKVS